MIIKYLLSEWKLHLGFFFLKIYLFLTVLGLSCCGGYSLVATSEGHSSLVVMCRLLIAVACLVVEQGLLGVQASGVAVSGL